MRPFVLVAAFLSLAGALQAPVIWNVGDLIGGAKTINGSNLVAHIAVSPHAVVTEYLRVSIDGGDQPLSSFLRNNYAIISNIKKSFSVSLTEPVVQNTTYSTVVFYVGEVPQGENSFSNILTAQDLTDQTYYITNDKPLVVLSPATTSDTVGANIAALNFTAGMNVKIEILKSDNTVIPIYTITKSASTQWKDVNVYGSVIRVQPVGGALANVKVGRTPSRDWSNYTRDVEAGDHGLVMTTSYKFSQGPAADPNNLDVRLQSKNGKKLKFSVTIVYVDYATGNLAIGDGGQDTYKYKNGGAVSPNFNLPAAITTTELRIAYKSAANNQGLLVYYTVEKGSASISAFVVFIIAACYSLVSL